MAARVLFQRRAAPLTAAVLVGGIAFYPRIAHAEAPVDRHLSKKPIYDDDYDVLPAAAAAATRPPSTTTTTKTTETASSVIPVLADASTTTTPASIFGQQQQQHQRGPTPTDRLAAQVRRGRLFLHAQTCAAEDAVNQAMSRAFDLEQSFTSTIASLAPPRESGEKLMPGLIYVLVAGMAGSIVARNRNVVVRAALPLALGLGAARLAIPLTAANVGELAWQYERRFPAVADAHVRAREGVEQGIAFVRVHANLASRKLTEAVTEARETVESWVRKGK
ncbi:apolipo protein O-domain-containing protein [Lasiosphaeria miniovina]|uniref:MICOS complex subunit n=1 Tax=Lasiosphaeria miniovina TaxID=1954250 RepID=A0AA40BFQ6_9PEZI|nr:apolipo protein O-domain-containing protein [Lasiosphaeria miniovina]KAK0733411.1 apolipo protein O-domain-containing protein [Lasiosphaeria miniovina]